MKFSKNVISMFDSEPMVKWFCDDCHQTFPNEYECRAHVSNKSCKNDDSITGRERCVRQARVTGEYLRRVVEAEQEEALRLVDEFDKKPVSRMVSLSTKKASSINVESDRNALMNSDSDSDLNEEEAIASINVETDPNAMMDSDSISDIDHTEEEAIVVDEVPSAPLNFKRKIEEEFKFYKRGKLEVKDPVTKNAFDVLVKCETEEEAGIKCESEEEWEIL